MILATAGHNVNWESVAVIVAAIATAAGVLGKYVLWQLSRAEDKRTDETRKIVLEVLSGHMRKEEKQRAKDARKMKQWRREVREQLNELKAAQAPPRRRASDVA